MGKSVKRTLVVAALAVSLATPAYAVGPLAAIVIGYVKQALKEKLIAYAKEKAMGLAGEALADVPGAGLLGMMPGMGGFRPRPGMSSAATVSLQAAGFNDTGAQPFTDAEWAEYEETVIMMAKAAGAGPDDMPDVAELRAGMANMPPQMIGMLRMQLRQFQEMKAEQAKMREAYAVMPEQERQEVVAELVRTFREQPVEYQPNAMQVLQSDALGLPDDLKKRLLVALKG
jgi:enoyl-CoA hydratase/carnithine racemase